MRNRMVDKSAEACSSQMRLVFSERPNEFVGKYSMWITNVSLSNTISITRLSTMRTMLWKSSTTSLLSEGTQVAKGAHCKCVTLDTSVVRVHIFRPSCDYCLHVSSVTQNLVEMCDYACVVELEYTFGLSPNAFMDWGFDSLRKYQRAKVDQLAESVALEAMWCGFKFHLSYHRKRWFPII